MVKSRQGRRGGGVRLYCAHPTILVNGADESREWTIRHHFKAIAGYTCKEGHVLEIPPSRDDTRGAQTVRMSISMCVMDNADEFLNIWGGEDMAHLSNYEQKSFAHHRGSRSPRHRRHGNRK